MLKNKDILDENKKILRTKSTDVIFPMKQDDLNNINLMIEYLINSQIEDMCQKYKLRPGMGLAAIQLGVPKRYFVIVHEAEDSKFTNYVIVNPQIISASDEMIYVDSGEGCLSVNRNVEGIVPRHARVTVEGFNIDGKKIKIRAREELAVAFQHEIDHLNGIIFTDLIDKEDPFKDMNKYRAI